MNYHFEDEEILAAVANTKYAKEQISRHLHAMTCDQKWSLYRAVATLASLNTLPEKQGCVHEPLLERDGKPIKGSKRCKHCGLNESYWNCDTIR